MSGDHIIILTGTHEYIVLWMLAGSDLEATPVLLARGEDFIAYPVKVNKLDRIIIVNRSDENDWHEIKIDENIYQLELMTEYYDSDRVLYKHKTPLRGKTVGYFHLQTKRSDTLAPGYYGGVDPKNYKMIWHHAPARDGETIPVVLLWHVNTPPSGHSPLFVTFYNFYGDEYTVRPKNWLSLTNRGVVSAYLLPSGGNIKGRSWWHRGRGTNCINRVTDVEDCIKYFKSEKLCDPKKIASWVASAARMVVTTNVKLDPSLFVAIAITDGVVDLAGKLCDKTNPTSKALGMEYCRGDPTIDLAAFEGAVQLSGRRGMVEGHKPHTLLLTGSVDHRVYYWVSCNYVLETRRLNTSDTDTLLFVDNTGHLGEAGRYSNLNRFAVIQAFFLAHLGLACSSYKERIQTHG
ncbi:hypothetical protein LTR37_018540 [Vermiconidia calcicola]|uniref:Uncharacterized protein n=1 Tax=Vermiconidia calcicola TaxID=1690605 RepID=A0ACC3MI75_9PEZI|nr:hypothetical protein LTR37_018540 [Vermiconidia calcicola]